VPYAPINGIDQVTEDPQVKHLGIVVPVENPHGVRRSVRPPVHFASSHSHTVRAAPLLDEDGAAIRAALAAGARWPEPPARPGVASG
jgi:crotonobetainyl-CoA:carnitine CoA-transferase CaiB-like acyl-CoA transferase